MKNVLLTGAILAASIWHTAHAQDSSLVINLVPETDMVVIEIFGRPTAAVMISALRINRSDEGAFMEAYQQFSQEKAPSHKRG